MASSISLIFMYSSAVWEREDSPGPSLSDGKRIKAWSLNVGEPNGFKPSLMQACTKGCFFNASLHKRMFHIYL